MFNQGEMAEAEERTDDDEHFSLKWNTKETHVIYLVIYLTFIFIHSSRECYTLVYISMMLSSSSSLIKWCVTKYEMQKQDFANNFLPPERAKGWPDYRL